uniref:Uncharacterized protein n=1 Tax=Candidatus Kentrum sp. LPFa TaxID=2126335 RepID=A0A450WMJ8_9GAMM|nr:MAG: hypothetical protein BECKLPF1236B_GA0070989_11373 [Candidatus Kentron sp. LPFa]
MDIVKRILSCGKSESDHYLVYFPLGFALLLTYRENKNSGQPGNAATCQRTATAGSSPEKGVVRRSEVDNDFEAKAEETQTNECNEVKGVCPEFDT